MYVCMYVCMYVYIGIPTNGEQPWMIIRAETKGVRKDNKLAGRRYFMAEISGLELQLQ